MTVATAPDFFTEVETGLHPGLPMDTYLGWRRVSASVICEATTSRSDAWLLDCIKGGPSEDTAAKTLGSLTHCAVLEPDLLSSQFEIEPEPDPTVFTNDDGKPSANPKATKKWKSLIRDLESRGKTIVSLWDYRNAVAMRDAVWNHKRARQLLNPLAGPVEISGAVTLEIDGVPVPVKIRPDKLHEKLGSNVQLKTSRNAHVESFMWDCWKMGHFLGGAFYERALNAVGFGCKKTHFIVIQNDGFPEVAVYEPDMGMASAAEDLCTFRLQRIARCIDSGVWPGISDEILPLALPHPAFERIAQEIQAA